jgi:hypothetical protein
VTVTASISENGGFLENGLVRLELERGVGHLAERLFAWNDGWQPILSSHRKQTNEPEFDCSPSTTRARILVNSPDQCRIALEGSDGPRDFTVEITLNDGERHIHYRVTEMLRSDARTRSLQSHYSFADRRVDFCFASHLRPHGDDVVGQYAFKSPATIIQRDARLAALIADVDLITKDAPQLVCLEPDISLSKADQPLMGYGFKDHEPHGLVYFRHRPDMIRALAKGARTYGYRLYLSASAEPKFGYREVVRLLWQLYGSANAASVVPQVISFDRYEDYALGYAMPHLWRDLPRDGVACGGITMGIKFPNDIWFHFFFNHLHSAYGLHLMGQRRGNFELIEKARKIRNLLFSAERKRGAIPAIFTHEIITGIRHDRWIPHAHWVGGSIPYQTQINKPQDQPAYSTMDGAWTCYWMLRWAEDISQDDDRLLSWPRDYGDLLCSVQLPSGSIPVWLHQDTLEPLDFLRENPSCAAAGLLLAKLYESTKEPRFLVAAEKVAVFLGERVMPQAWADYECFHDSAGKPVDLVDPYSGQRPQCTFPIFWTAELAKLLYRLTGRQGYLDQALRAVDYLLLFQGVWSPPYLTVKGFGSIGIGNGHTGWNDARAGIFAPGIADFATLTGSLEYLQRGVAAMRAPLALMYIPENEAVSSVFDKGPLGYADECYAHRGRDARLGPSCYDFSVGYALVAYEELHRHIGSAFIDVVSGSSVGIDGCLPGLTKANGKVLDLAIDDRVGKGRRLKVKLSGTSADFEKITVNGKPAVVIRQAGDSCWIEAGL